MHKAISALQGILKASIATGGSPLEGIKKVYYGDPVKIPESSLPALTISPLSTDIERRGSKYDQKTRRIQVSLVYNQKDYFGNEGTDVEKVAVVEDAFSKIGEENSDLETAALSVCGLIQRNNTLTYSGSDAVTDARVVNVQYRLTKLRGYNTFEAVVTVETQTISDR